MSGTLRLNDTTFATETNGNITTNVSELKINDQTVIDSNKSLNVSDVKVGGNTVIDSNRKMTGVDIVPTTNFTFRNKIINGNLKSARVINQRGASSIAPEGATGYTYDRWYYDDGSKYLYQGIEDLNVNNGTYCVSWMGSDITAQYLLSTDTTASNGWDGAGTFQTVANGGTFTVNESPEHGKHLWIRFSGTLSNLDKVMVEEGTVPTPFEHRPYGIELILCKRFFQKSYNDGTAPGTITDNGKVMWFTSQQWGVTSVPAGPQYQGYTRLPVELRAVSTVIPYSNSTGTANRFVLGSTGNDVTPNAWLQQAPSTIDIGYPQNSGGGAFGNSDFITFHWTADAEL